MQKINGKMQDRKAFTLIELLVVVAIIGILAAVGVVAYNGYTSSAKKSVVKANHSLVKKYVISEITKCNSLDVEFDSIINKSFQSNPSANCSSNKNCSAVKSTGSPGNGWYLGTVICPLLYYDMIKNPFNNNANAFEQNSSIPPISKLGYTFMNSDGATYILSTRYGTGAKDYLTEKIEFPY
jgi:prepilin-type N-terminal cleavage/methylation domain-containing protein